MHVHTTNYYYEAPFVTKKVLEKVMAAAMKTIYYRCASLMHRSWYHLQLVASGVHCILHFLTL
jgi:hypothetical protein